MNTKRTSGRLFLRRRISWLGLVLFLPISFGQGVPSQDNPPGSKQDPRGTQPPNNQAGRGVTPPEPVPQSLQERRNRFMNSVNGVRRPDRPTGMTPPGLTPPLPIQRPAGQNNGFGTSQIVPQTPSGPVGTRLLSPNQLAPWTANQPEEPPSMRLRLEGRNVIAEIRNEPLQTVLDELAAWSGVVFEVESQNNPKVSINLYGTSVEEAVQRVTKNDNWIAYYDLDAAGQDHLAFVRIFDRTPRSAAPILHYIGTGTATKHSDEIIDTPEQAIAVLAGSANPVARRKAVEMLMTSKSPIAFTALMTELGDPAVEVKVAAIDGLARLGAHNALPEILPSLKDEDPGVRQSAVLAIGLLGDSANVKDLRPLLNDPDANVKSSAATVIQMLSVKTENPGLKTGESARELAEASKGAGNRNAIVSLAAPCRSPGVAI